MRYTYKQFKADYPDDEACLLSVLENRYGSTCPNCGVIDVKFHPIKGRQAFVCSECDKHIYPLAGTIFRKTTTPLTSWFHAIYLFSVAKNGVSAKELERHLGVTYKTAWRMCKLIRTLMADDDIKLSGEVEVDETYIHANSAKRTSVSKRAYKIGNFLGGQTVFGMVERGGMVKALHVYNAGLTSIMPNIHRYVEEGTLIFSDEAMVYKSLTERGYPHLTTCHGKKEYVNGDNHTQNIENIWGQMKRSLNGTYHSVSPKYLQNYINEFTFRYNFRSFALCPILVERAAKLS